MGKLADRLMMAGAIAPFAMLVPILASFFASNYSWLSQHMSELQLRDDLFSVTPSIGAFVAGLSLIAFSIGALLRRGFFTALTAFAFGLGMLTNGIFPTGTPLHGLYGMAIFMLIVPAIFVGEFNEASQPNWFRNYSYATAVLTLIYMWFLFVGFDPAAYRGLTQRIGTLISFSWYAVAAIRIHKMV